MADQPISRLQAYAPFILIGGGTIIFLTGIVDLLLARPTPWIQLGVGAILVAFGLRRYRKLREASLDGPAPKGTD